MDWYDGNEYTYYGSMEMNMLIMEEDFKHFV